LDDFLRTDRPRSVFIGSAQEIKEIVEEAFSAVMGRPMPSDILVHILDKEGMIKAHSAPSRNWNEAIHGFAINRRSFGQLSEVFVRKGELDKIMITLGHELGHVLSKRLEKDVDEEAKAFAFSLAWMRKIKELNIGNLATAIRLGRPASNGLHDVALDFVLESVKKQDPLEVFYALSQGSLGVKHGNL